MAHITIMSGSTALTNKHLRPNQGKRDSPQRCPSTQHIEKAGLDNKTGGDPETLSEPKNCLQKYKTCAFFGGIGIVVTLTVILIILAATGAFDKGSS